MDADGASMDIDSLLSEVMGKMGDLTTRGLSSEEEKDEMVAAFMEVLKVSHEEATFFLDSAAGNLESAIALWLDELGSTRHHHKRYNNTYQQGDHNNQMNAPIYPPVQRFVPRRVVIEGLDPDWEASVNATYGYIQFTHLPTGMTQSEVPHGFADPVGPPAGMEGLEGGEAGGEGGGEAGDIGMETGGGLEGNGLVAGPENGMGHMDQEE